MPFSKLKRIIIFTVMITIYIACIICISFIMERSPLRYTEMFAAWGAALILSYIILILSRSQLQIPAVTFSAIFLLGFSGYFQATLPVTEVNIELKNDRIIKANYLRSLDRGCLVTTDNKNYELIPWSEIRSLDVKNIYVTDNKP